MKIFITGGSGFIGKSIIRKLLSENISVSALLLPNDNLGDIQGVEIVQGNITNPESLLGVTKGHDAVIHLAGAVAYGQTMENCLLVNRDGTENMMKEAINSNVKRFIHMSSVSVYGRVPNVEIDENYPMKKIGDPYGDTKIDAEGVVEKLAAGSAIQHTIIRPTVIYGREDVLFLPLVIAQITSGKAKIIGDGLNTVNVIHVEDVSDFMHLVLTNEKSVGKIYNLTHPSSLNWNEFMAETAKAVGVEDPIAHVPYRVAMTFATLSEFISRFNKKPPALYRFVVRNTGRSYIYNTDRMQKELGFTPKIGLKEGIKEYVQSLQKSKN